MRALLQRKARSEQQPEDAEAGSVSPRDTDEEVAQSDQRSTRHGDTKHASAKLDQPDRGFTPKFHSKDDSKPFSTAFHMKAVPAKLTGTKAAALPSTTVAPAAPASRRVGMLLLVLLVALALLHNALSYTKFTKQLALKEGRLLTLTSTLEHQKSKMEEMRHLLDEAAADRTRISTALDEAKQKLIDMQEDLLAITNEATTLRTEARTLRSTLASKQDELQSATVALAAATARAQVAEHTNQDLHNKLEVKVKEVKVLEGEALAFEAEWTKMTAALKGLEGQAGRGGEQGGISRVGIMASTVGAGAGTA